MPPDPAAIARRLTEAQKRALLACERGMEPHARPDWCFKETWRRYMFQLREKGIMRAASRDARHQCTPFGQAVRAELERMEAKDD